MRGGRKTRSAAMSSPTEASTSNDLDLVQSVLDRIAKDLAMILDRELALSGCTAERRTERPVGADQIHISFRLGFVGATNGQGCLLLPLPEAISLAGYLMMGFGLVSFLVAGLFIHRQHDIKRLFSYSSIEHMGLMSFAFGLGGPLATFGALLHMTVHSLTKSAIFVTVGHASRIAGTQNMERIRGLISTQPNVGWGLLIGTLAIAGFPPFGVFASEFLLLSATIENWPWLAMPLLIGLAIAFAGLFRHLHPIVFGAQPEGQAPVRVNMQPVYLQLALVLWLGVAIPGFLARWFDQATRLITGSGLL